MARKEQEIMFRPFKVKVEQRWTSIWRLTFTPSEQGERTIKQSVNTTFIRVKVPTELGETAFWNRFFTFGERNFTLKSGSGCSDLQPVARRFPRVTLSSRCGQVRPSARTRRKKSASVRVRIKLWVSHDLNHRFQMAFDEGCLLIWKGSFCLIVVSCWWVVFFFLMLASAVYKARCCIVFTLKSKQTVWRRTLYLSYQNNQLYK